MRESLAEERQHCQDRLERQAGRARQELQATQQDRDTGLRRDIAHWLQSVIADIEQGEQQVRITFLLSST